MVEATKKRNHEASWILGLSSRNIQRINFLILVISHNGASTVEIHPKLRRRNIINHIPLMSIFATNKEKKNLHSNTFI